MRYILVDGKWHIYEMDGARAESTACGITEWPLDPEWTSHEPADLCAKCRKASKAE